MPEISAAFKAGNAITGACREVLTKHMAAHKEQRRHANNDVNKMKSGK